MGANIDIKDSVFAFCDAGTSGGGIKMDDRSALVAQGVNWTSCSATLRGGALQADASTLDVENAVFDSCVVRYEETSCVRIDLVAPLTSALRAFGVSGFAGAYFIICEGGTCPTNRTYAEVEHDTRIVAAGTLESGVTGTESACLTRPRTYWLRVTSTTASLPDEVKAMIDSHNLVVVVTDSTTISAFALGGGAQDPFTLDYPATDVGGGAINIRFGSYGVIRQSKFLRCATNAYGAGIMVIAESNVPSVMEVNSSTFLDCEAGLVGDSGAVLVPPWGFLLLWRVINLCSECLEVAGLASART